MLLYAVEMLKNSFQKERIVAFTSVESFIEIQSKAAIEDETVESFNLEKTQ